MRNSSTPCAALRKATAAPPASISPSVRARWTSLSGARGLFSRWVIQSCPNRNSARNLHETAVLRRNPKPAAGRTEIHAVPSVQKEAPVAQTDGLGAQSEETPAQKEKAGEMRPAMSTVVPQWDTANTEAFERAILAEFPGFPRDQLPRILKRALGQGKIGRGMGLDDAERAALAVKAHIRHLSTDYEHILYKRARHDANGVTSVGARTWQQARTMVRRPVDALAATWGRSIPHLFPTDTSSTASKAHPPAQVPAWALPNSSRIVASRIRRSSMPQQPEPKPLTRPSLDLVTPAETQLQSSISSYPASSPGAGVPLVPKSPPRSARAQWDALRARKRQTPGPS